MLPNDTQAALQDLRDGLRSARRPGELLSPLDRAAMLGMIARVGLAVARDLGHDRRDGDVGDANAPSPPCPVERLAFLQTIIPQVAAASQRIGSEPPAALRTTERLVPMERARHVSASALRTLTRMPFAARIGETVAVPTPDTLPNRAAKTILAAFARDTATIAALAQNAGLSGAFAEAERLRRRLSSVLRRKPWRDLPLLPRVPPLIPTLRHHGAHVLLHDVHRRYRAGFSWDFSHPLFTLPQREMWQLYEYYTFFAVIEVLRGIGFRALSEKDIGVVRVSESGVSLVLATGTASRLTLRRGNQTVRVTYQRRFDRDNNDGAGFHSVAHTLVPDMVLEHDGQLLILDAKFRTYADPAGVYLSPLDDSRQLHSYRDAIRRGTSASAVRPVTAAWVLYAGRVTGANRAIIAFPGSSPARPFGNGEIGAILLRPGVGNDTLAALMEDFLRAAHTSVPSTNAPAR